MSPITHLLISWVVADADNLNRRERTIVTVAGIAPDVDGFGIVAEALTRESARPLTWWTDYHHVLGHNLAFGLVVAAGSFALATKRWKTAALAFLTFHFHLLCDLIGARGPEGYQWPIPYFYPFSDLEWTWAGQWQLNAWPNFVVTGIVLLLTFYWAWGKGHSPIEMVSVSADKAFVETLRRRVPINDN
jgi:hypothetical protein